MQLAQIWRHPIKGIGAEALDATTLSENMPLPMDRAWAFLEEGQTDTGAWQACRNFLRGAKAPGLMAIEATLTGDRIDLRHPDRGPISIDPATDGAQLAEWLGDIWPAERPAPGALIKAPEQGMSDIPFPSISILSLSSLHAVSAAAGVALDPRRFRGNLWLDGADPWAEPQWIGKRLAVGGAVLEIVEPIGRCRATEANPETGHRDVAMLSLLKELTGDTKFGVYAKVIQAGEIAAGDPVAVL
ncbi:MAG: MOSC domain-containing protein [Mangrovicoccus sp.]